MGYPGFWVTSQALWGCSFMDVSTPWKCSLCSVQISYMQPMQPILLDLSGRGALRNFGALWWSWSPPTGSTSRIFWPPSIKDSTWFWRFFPDLRILWLVGVFQMLHLFQNLILILKFNFKLSFRKENVTFLKQGRERENKI